MIHTSKQLKDKVRNISKGDNNVALALIRNFFMERFLERVSRSVYSYNFILKGGMLVASLVGSDLRATMDIDATVKSLPLKEEEATRIISEICGVSVEDGVRFSIASVMRIMQDFEYPGIRIILEARLERMRQMIKIDISTDDIITPSEVQYEYKLMFEERTISILTYNKETLLAEKVQTIFDRGIANTRMRDFYDIYEIINICGADVDKRLFLDAFRATCEKRETVFSKEEMTKTVAQLAEDEGMAQMWERFRIKNYFAGSLEWSVVVEKVMQTIQEYIIAVD